MDFHILSMSDAGKSSPYTRRYSRSAPANPPAHLRRVTTTPKSLLICVPLTICTSMVASKRMTDMAVVRRVGTLSMDNRLSALKDRVTSTPVGVITASSRSVEHGRMHNTVGVMSTYIFINTLT